MKKILAAACLLFQNVCFANSVSMFNDSIYTLKATIYDATGTLLGEFILTPRDAAEWSDNLMNFGTETQDASQTPYVVNWLCMNGSSYGSCNNVAAGSVVTAQSCGGEQQCQGASQPKQPPAQQENAY
jgi:hypothetical protein